jgi:hypothetical protein
MKNLLPLSTFCCAILVWLSSCSAANPITPGPIFTQPATQSTSAPTNPNLSDLIGEIIASPDDFKGKIVEIVGYFRGWDLMDEAGGPPPVTRSDWVIADNSGAIYVTGDLPQGLDPASPQAVWTVVRLEASVASQQDQVYLEAQSVELVPEQ